MPDAPSCRIAIVIMLLGSGMPALAQTPDPAPAPPPVVYGPPDPPASPTSPAPAADIPAAAPAARQCEAFLRTPLGPRSVLCPLAGAPPLGEPCDCPFPPPPPGVPASPPALGHVVP